MSSMPPLVPPSGPLSSGPLSTIRIFPPGRRCFYLWERGETDYKRFEPTDAFCSMLLAHDQTGVIIHSVEPVPESSTEASEFCTPARVKAFNARGVRVIIGVGCRAPPFWQGIAKAIIKAIDACKRADSPCDGVNVDWEGSWSGHRDIAKLLIAAILAVHADAGLYMSMPCWWAPLELPNGHATQPSAPTAEWLAVIDSSVPINPQDYGAGGAEFESKHMLEWSRQQYAKHFGMPAWRVLPSVQMYHRTLADHVDLLLREPSVNQWDFLEADSVCLHANRVSRVLRVAGIVGADWVRLFQKAHPPLVVDGKLGPLSMAALETVTA